MTGMDRAMRAANPLTVGGKDELARAEARMTRVAWFGGVAVGLVTAATLALLLLVKASETWEFVLYPLLGGVPFGYAVFSTFLGRKMQVEILETYQMQVLHEITDLQDKVYRDELTDLHNRRHFYEVVQCELEKAYATKQPLAIVVMDLDGLKKINDEYGHGVGDSVLAGLGRVIQRHVRTQDVAARLGGDEFGVIMPDTDKRGAFALAARLWEDLSSAPVHVHNGEPLIVSVSIGLAGFPWGGETLEELLQWADADMYANKLSRKLPQSALTGQPRQEPTESGGYFEGE